MEWDDSKEVGKWIRRNREVRGWSQGELAARLSGFYHERTGLEQTFSQQTIGNWEKGKAKRPPEEIKLLTDVFRASDEETKEDPYLSTGHTDASVLIRHMPTRVGLGGGGTGEGDPGLTSFSRDLVENELRAAPDDLMVMIAEGNSMEPDFLGGDQILVDTRKQTLAQPGAFCLWDGDGYVVKYLQRIHGSEPPKVRVVSKNEEIYRPEERLLEEVDLIGRVVWFGRRVQ